MNKKYGFSLIELMIVIAIIGILASIGIPAYNDYMVRTRVTELVTAADSIKILLQENATFNSGFSKATNLAAIDATDPSTTGVLAQVSLSENSDTEVYLHMCGAESRLGIPAGAGNYLGIVFHGTYSDTAGVKWECQYKGPANFDKYVPASCKTPTTSTSNACTGIS